MRLRQHIAALAGVLLVGSSLVLPATAAAAAPLPTAPIAPASFKACEAVSGVGNVSSAGTSKPQPVDENVAVYVGGSFTRAAGAELEGQLVVNGDALLDGNALFNMGWVGVGSGVLPVSGTDLVRVGGDFTINGTSRAEISSKAADDALLPGNVKVGGLIETEAKLVHGGGGTVEESLGRSAALGSNFANWPNKDFAVLSDFTTRNLTGTPGTYKTESWGRLELRGTAGADRHLFSIPAAELSARAFTLHLFDIDPTDVIVIQVTGTTPAIVNVQGIYNGEAAIPMGDVAFGQIASRTLWAFPESTHVEIAGAQVPGSIVVPRSDSHTYHKANGTNGRVWVAGHLTQDNGNGSEFHSFPFLGDPDSTCGTPMIAPVPGGTVVPVLPTVVESVCTAGVASTPSVTLPADSADVTYVKSGAEVAGGTVTVVATAEGTNEFDASVTGWTISGDRKTATRVITLVDPGCVILPVAVTPVTPTIENVCVAGGTSTPTVVFDISTGVTYEITAGSVVPGTTVTVTATAVPGYVLDPAAGWTVAPDNFTATMQMEIPAALECAPVTVDPGITQATCAAGATLTLPTTPGIVYTSSNASPAAGETVTITATPEAGYALTSGDGWTLHTDGTATKQFTLTKPTCGTGAGGTPGAGDLATTGGTPVPGWVVGGGLAAVIAGAVLLFVRRRALGSTDS